MGIAIKEILSQEFFREFEVIAGKKGLYKEVQGITVLEAPDGFRWTKGKELVLSSGYIIMNSDCIEQGFRDGSIQQISGLVIKEQRYMEQVSEHMIQLFEEHNIPLIRMPFSISWMELMSQVNVAVMNRATQRFRILNSTTWNLGNQSYKDQKIRKILQAVEVEMNFPAFLYDLADEKAYYSSANFQGITAQFNLTERDYWEPSKPYTKHTLCDYINMTRYRLLNNASVDEPRISWIIIPIVMNQVTQAYFVVMESKEFVDYYDEYALRIAFLLLQSVYEQIVVARNVGNIGFENFIHYALTSSSVDSHKLVAQANVQGISVKKEYIHALFIQKNTQFSARKSRRTIMEAYERSSISKMGELAFLEENEGMILIETNGEKRHTKDYVQKLLMEFNQRVEERCPEASFEYGMCREKKTLLEIKSAVDKCWKVINMGRILYPERKIWDYEMLGPLAWINIPEDELAVMLADYKGLMKDEKHRELLRTLKTYLENNMNYSVTAEKMYVHINTIRKRIDKINELLSIDWDEHVGRLKVELLLQFLNLS